MASTSSWMNSQLRVALVENPQPVLGFVSAGGGGDSELKGTSISQGRRGWGTVGHFGTSYSSVLSQYQTNIKENAAVIGTGRLQIFDHLSNLGKSGTSSRKEMRTTRPALQPTFSGRSSMGTNIPKARWDPTRQQLNRLKPKAKQTEHTCISNALWS